MDCNFRKIEKIKVRSAKLLERGSFDFANASLFQPNRNHRDLDFEILDI